MKEITILLFALLIFCDNAAQAQTRHLVQFKNKDNNNFSLANPSAFLSARSIARRTRYGIGLDSTDLPVTERYLDSIRAVPNVTILNVSKWLNQVSILTSDAAALSKINSFPFVVATTPTAARISESVSKKFADIQNAANNVAARMGQAAADYFNYGQSYAQVHLHNGEFLHNLGLRGQGMIIGMLDAGFNNYLGVTAFDSARANGQILGTYDYVSNNTNVNDDASHGMQCFSTIAANIPGQFVGTAPKANFYLFRTEDAATEYPIEEHNWVCGAERLDSAGTDVLSSSLGYYDFQGAFNNSTYNHTYAQMDGNTTMSAIGADLAAKKGLVVFNSAGNSGNSGSYRFIFTPADADSILAVGAVNSSGAVASFSSYGPSSDGQIKPDVASVGAGTIVQFPNNAIGGNNGTSFACPNLAGLVTCLWQGFPEMNNMKIVNAIRLAGHKANTPDDRVGYGIPDVKKAIVQLIKDFATTTVTSSNCKATISWTSKDMSAMKYEIDRKLPGETSFKKIAEQLGTGVVFGTRSYSFADSLINVPAGAISYRIRQLVDTAAATIAVDTLQTVSVTPNCILTVQKNHFLLLPNPARQQVTIRHNSDEAMNELEIVVRNAAGSFVLQKKVNKGPGLEDIDLSVMQLSSGTYYVSLYHKGTLLGTKELIKL